MIADFVHLRVHSAYSLAEGAVRIDELIDLCKKNKMPAVAVTDTSNLFGALEFSIAAARAGIQPIIGCNIYLVDNNFENGYLLLIAKNELGFKNLSRLVTISYLENSKENYPYISFLYYKIWVLI